MTLRQWLASLEGGKSELARLTGLSWPAIHRAEKGRASLETARLISAVTGGKVAEASMTRATPPDVVLARMRKRAS